MAEDKAVKNKFGGPGLGRYFGMALDARKIAQAIHKGEPPPRPKRSSATIADVATKYSEAVMLLAVFRIEELLRKDDLEPKDAALLLREIREHMVWTQSLRPPRKHWYPKDKPGGKGVEAPKGGESLQKGAARPMPAVAKVAEEAPDVEGLDV